MAREHKRKGIIVDLFQEQAGYCCYCARPMTLKLNKTKTATVDHIKPKSNRGRYKTKKKMAERIIIWP